MGMDMNDVEFADLTIEALQDIRTLEARLREETSRDVILLAYEERVETSQDVE